MICSIENCSKDVHCKNLCNTHYRRLMKYGDPKIKKIRNFGEGTLHNSGYWMFEINGRSILRHILKAEIILGKRLPKGAEVHHIDNIRSNDENNNLVICQNRGYHQLLHKRAKALKNCGHADWIKCQICKKYSPKEEIKMYSNGVKWHPECWKIKFGKRR